MGLTCCSATIDSIYSRLSTVMMNEYRQERRRRAAVLHIKCRDRHVGKISVGLKGGVLFNLRSSKVSTLATLAPATHA